VEPAATSARRGWVGLEAAHFRATPAFELDDIVPTHHTLALFVRPPRTVRSAVGGRDATHTALRRLELDPARVSIPALDGLQHRQLQWAILAVNDELSAEGSGDRLAVESLANVLAVHLIRNACALRPARRADGAPSQAKLQTVMECIDEYLDTDLTVAQLAAVFHLSAYHFARQFKAATGVPPHRYVVARRVERAQQLIRHSSPRTSSVRSASRRDSSASRHGSPKTPQVSARNAAATPPTISP
jgi:AraC-like DNA-binding protein